MDTPRDTTRSRDLAWYKTLPATRDSYELDLAEPPGTGNSERYWHALRPNRVLLLALALAGVVAGLAISHYQPEIYRARTSLEIEGFNENVLRSRDVDGSGQAGYYTSDAYLQTQAELLKTRSLIERTIDKLSPEWVREISTDPDPRGALFRRSAGSEKGPRERAIENAVRNTSVYSSRQSRIIELLFDSHNPKAAASFVNTLAQEFIERDLELRWDGATTRLAAQLETLRRKLNDAESKLQAYSQASGLLGSGDKNDLSEDRVSRVQEELLRAQADRIAKQSRYEMASARTAESLPDVLDSPIMRDAQARLMDLERQYADLNAYLTPAHYNVQRIAAQITELRSNIQKERDKVLKRIKNDYDAASAREGMLERTYAEQYRKAAQNSSGRVRYSALKSEVESYRNLYALTLQRVNEAQMGLAIRSNNIHVVDKAIIPERPYSPNRALSSLFGLAGGFGVGLLLIFARLGWNRKFLFPGEASAHLNVPELGAVPSVVAPGRAIRATNRLLGSSIGVAPGQEQRIGLATWEQKLSPVADSFRWTLASIMLSTHVRQRLRVLVLTSPGEKDGKTTAASNLAIALTELKLTVLLIDADLRRPRLHELYGIDNEMGLSDLLLEPSVNGNGQHFDRYIRTTAVPGLSLMTSGSQPADTPQIAGKRLGCAIKQFREQFDVVLFDTPPVLSVTEARVIGRLADGVVLVLRAGQTPKVSAEIACRRLADDGIPVIGTILNNWDGAGPGYSGYYRYAYRPRE